MALFDISLPGGTGTDVAVEPGLTVLVGLAPERRHALVEALRGWAAGDDAPSPVARAGVPIRLHGGADAARAVVLDAAALAACLARPAGTDAAGEAARAHAAACTSLDALDDVLDVVEAEVADAAAARAEALGAIERGAAAIDTDAPAAITRLRAELGADGASGVDQVGTLAQRARRLEALASAAATLASADPRPVASAVDALRRATAPAPEPSREARLLADEWANLRGQLEVVERRLARSGVDLDEAGRELDEARARVERAEDAARRPAMSADDMRALEEAHEAVLEAEQKASGRFGGARARRALDAAMEAEREILDRLGYPTWSAWVMGDRLLDSTSRAKRDAALARRDVQRAEAAWADTLARLDADPAFAELMGRLDDLYQRAVAIVGEHDDVEAALRRATVGGDRTPVAGAGLAVADDTDAAARDGSRVQGPSGSRTARLRGALAAVGLDLDPHLDAAELVAVADAWLDAVAPLVQHRHLVEDAQRHAEAELALVTTALGAAGAELTEPVALPTAGFVPASLADDAGRTPSASDAAPAASTVATVVPGLRRAALLRRLEEAEARRDRHEEALIALSARWCEALAAQQVEQAATAERDAKRALWELSARAERAAARRLGPAAGVAAAIAARARELRRDGLAPLLVLDDALAGAGEDLVAAVVAALDATPPRTPVVWLVGDAPPALPPDGPRFHVQVVDRAS